MAKIAVLGHGVVGSGTVELFLKNKEDINKKQGLDLELGYVLDIRDFPGLPYSDKFTKDINDILNDDDVKVVAEVMGGVNPAFDFVKSCLMKGKSVCTSNKELVAKKGAELLSIAKENNCNFMFEASTGGAIPVIRPLHTCLAGNEITACYGILNGTTNYILTKMNTEGLAFDTALKQAQELGYAEKDPTADIEGHDACRKICILSSLIYGKHVYPDSIHCEGITKLSKEDFAFASAADATIKLVGSVSRLEDGKILPAVAPAVVGKNNMLYNVSDVFNGIVVDGDGFDQVMFYGRGAGKLPTASAVLGDIIDCAKLENTCVSLTWEDNGDNSFIADFDSTKQKFMIKLEGNDTNGVAEAFGENASVKAIDGNCAVISVLSVNEIKAASEKLGRNVLSMIRIIDADNSVNF